MQRNDELRGMAGLQRPGPNDAAYPRCHGILDGITGPWTHPSRSGGGRLSRPFSDIAVISSLQAVGCNY
jgi:hypothetical protein